MPRSAMCGPHNLASYKFAIYSFGFHGLAITSGRNKMSSKELAKAFALLESLGGGLYTRRGRFRGLVPLVS